MNSRTAILGFILVVATLPLFARAKTDLLIMKNGDRMTCEVKGLETGVLYVSFDYIDGTASVDWSKVARVESTQSFLVKTEDGSVYSGTLHTMETPTGRPVRIQVVEDAAHETELDRAKIIAMNGTSDNFWERFNGQVSFGLNYSKGNQTTQYSLGSEAAYVRERWTGQANFTSNLSSSNGATASTRNELTLFPMRLLRWNNWFYAGLGDFLQSSVQGISLQTSLGAGVGRYLKNTNRMRIYVVGGAVWQNTRYQSASANTPNLAAGLVYADANLFQFSKTNLSITAALIPAVSDPGRVHFNTNASYYIKLFRNLKWNTSFYGSWDNRPPSGFSGSDYGTSTGLTWTFGLK
jgi:hypothetical protein